MFRTTRHRLGVLLLAVLGLALVAACAGTPTGSPTTAGPTPSASTGVVTISITLAGGTVTPNGEKYDVVVGQTVVLEVTSDHDDEIHVHSEPEVSLEVKNGVPARTEFVAQQRGAFEVESHHPEKVIAILNVR